MSTYFESGSNIHVGILHLAAFLAVEHLSRHVPVIRRGIGVNFEPVLSLVVVSSGMINATSKSCQIAEACSAILSPCAPDWMLCIFSASNHVEALTPIDTST